MVTGNKGEWSELYALFKLLGDSGVYAGDEHLNRIEELYYPILSIIRQKEERLRYDTDVVDEVVVVYEGGEEVARISMERFREMANSLLPEIKQSTGRAFHIPVGESYMKEAHCSQLKAPSSDKTDIRLVIHDLYTGQRPELGFSIKSKLGSPATLLNASAATLFEYEVAGHLSDDDIDRYNAMGQVDRLRQLITDGHDLTYVGMPHSTFRNNLMLIDTSLPQIIAECLKVFMTTDVGSGLCEITQEVAQRNPLKIIVPDNYLFYSFKIKKLLIDAALGMKPATNWTGRYDANGGYLVVKNDGEIICYHFYNVNSVEDYLFNDTRLCSPDHRGALEKFGSLYRDEAGKVKVCFVLQIRFK